MGPARLRRTPQATGPKKPSPNIPNNLTDGLTRKEDALAFAGWESCASDREFWWHHASDTPEQWDRWPGVTNYEWKGGEGCDVSPLDGAAMVRDMVEDGGWLLLGGKYVVFVPLFYSTNAHLRLNNRRPFLLPLVPPASTRPCHTQLH